jgi:hypothetical protein
MAVVECHEIWQGRGSSEDQKAKRQYTRVFRVLVDDVTTSSLTVREAVQINRFQAFVDSDGRSDPLGAFASDIKAVQQEDPFEWLVTVEYSNRTDQPQLGNENPTQRVPEVTWDTEQFQQAIDKDLAGKPLVNSAGEKFDPPVAVDDCRPLLKVLRYEEVFVPAIAILYKDAVNSDNWNGFVPGQVKSKMPTAVRQYENGVFYYAVTYIFHIRPEGWLRLLLDVGRNTLDPITDDPVLITDKYGQPLSVPSLLNGDGQLLRNAQSKLSNAINDLVQAITVDDGDGFPQTPDALPYLIQIDNEILQVDFGAGSNVFAVRRGLQSTQRVPHAKGAAVKMLPYYLSYQVYRTFPFTPLGLF